MVHTYLVIMRQDISITIRISEKHLRYLDNLRRMEPGQVPSRSEMVRLLIDRDADQRADLAPHLEWGELVENVGG